MSGLHRHFTIQVLHGKKGKKDEWKRGTKEGREEGEEKERE